MKNNMNKLVSKLAATAKRAKNQQMKLFTLAFRMEDKT